MKKHFLAVLLSSCFPLFSIAAMPVSSDMQIATVSYPASTNLLSPDAPLFTVTKDGKQEVFTANKLNSQKSYKITVRMHSNSGDALDKQYSMEALAGVPVDSMTKDPGDGVILSGEITDESSPHLDVIVGYEKGERIHKISDEQSFPVQLNTEQKLGTYKIDEQKSVDVFATISPL